MKTDGHCLAFPLAEARFNKNGYDQHEQENEQDKRPSHWK